MPRTPQQAYDELIRRMKEIELLGSCAGLLGWDQRTCMPAKASPYRAEQLALLSGMVHQKFTDPEIGGLIGGVEGSALVADPESVPAVNVREWRRSYDRATRLPKSLVEELTRTCALAHDVWAGARKTSDFPKFRPYLEKVVGLKRQEADAYGFAHHPYDALLEDYEPGETTANLTQVFAGLREELAPLIGEVVGSGRCPDTSVLNRDYPIDRQEAFGKMAAAAIGFDFEAGRLDVTVHPFCSGLGRGDTRLTTRYDARQFHMALFGILHEAGHGLYEQGLDPEHSGTPMAEAVSLGIHESQSRMWENFVGRGRAFWAHFFPLARHLFHESLSGVSPDGLHFAINDVRPSFIRVEADEATYNLHILLRFELEQALLTGDLKAGDVPGAWNERFKKYFDLTPPDDAQGCLQDTHWSGGGIGYFPTYSLGNLYAAQFFEQARKDLGDLDAQFARGEFLPLRDWLREKIHRQGMRYRAGQLVERVTGRPLSHEPLMAHLRAKYGALYGI
ncbi:MAG: peptidase M32 [Candidatus Handelsmanbacteria bacterium RIFCSPLOWO2_12_FULL_64_10]|uniref:Metal-dependent carboxypeptidase n=1 Tax=Handelsmanbacteria sp. (strain RIFCSPLOWO2_12_FULL_64_10) TaxID=1817868 RepID=A0A1F6D1N3_HANXR|nr:MAG: peptidase M32 [Candidatus Handelsmanbacteria bacterium RIFCSPLOWO2_12_FULL_64_10]